MGCTAALVASAHLAGAEERFMPGAPGLGDAYFPLDGNGGYDVEHYLLQVRYDPASDRLSGVATLTARATQNLSRFNLDLDGLEVSAVEVDGCAAAWSRDAGELRITPERGLRDRAPFTVAVTYGGVPQTLDQLGPPGFIHTSDGALVAGQPHGAATWFPANDHPRDRATFTFEVSVPIGLEVAANGSLTHHETSDGWTTWRWEATAPMATYLAGMSIGDLMLRSYEVAGIHYWDSIPAQYFVSPAPATGSQFLISGEAEGSFKRLSRVLAVPPEGASLSFRVTRRTEPAWDFFFVEARTSGKDDWRTLPEVSGATSADVGFACDGVLDVHPFLTHYLASSAVDESCVASGDTGDWWAAAGASQGPEPWTIDLSAYAGANVEVSLSYASDAVIQDAGVFLDDIVVSTGEGSTSFEDDGDVLDGWRVAGPPDGSPGNTNDWLVGTVADAPPPSRNIAAALARQPEIIAFLEERLGPYPFADAGAIVTDAEISFALELQTRPIYAAFVVSEPSAVSTVAHELAHQWFGDSLSLESWQHIWLNEGFATYAEWLWDEREGTIAMGDRIASLLALDPSDPFWSVIVADPGPGDLLDGAIYDRGALTLHHLRLAVGDERFFEILQTWASSRAGESVTTDEFIALAEALSGLDLGAFFDTWLYLPERPPSAALEPAQASERVPAAARPVARQALGAHHFGAGTVEKSADTTRL